MPNVILHMGIQKTGTSALQVFLANNRQVLERNGMYYPLARDSYFADGNTGPDVINGVSLYTIGCGIQNYVTERFINELDDALASYDTVILSCEWFNKLTFTKMGCQYVKDLFDALDITATIVIYLRRQVDWLESFWRQLSKQYSSRSDESIKGLKNFIAPNSRFARIADYNWVLKRIEEAFGCANIIVRRYERNRLLGKDICQDFCSVIGLELDDTFRVDQTLQNESISTTTAFAAAQLQQSNFPQRSNISVGTYALQVDKLLGEDRAASMLSYDEAAQLMERYAKSNAQVAKRYFPGEELFDPIDPAAWVEWEYDPVRIREAETLLLAAILADRSLPERAIQSQRGYLAQLEQRLNDIERVLDAHG